MNRNGGEDDGVGEGGDDMGRAQQIIDRILADRRERLARGGSDPARASFADKVAAGTAEGRTSGSDAGGKFYEDEPILKTGRQLVHEAAQRNAVQRKAARREAKLGNSHAAGGGHLEEARSSQPRVSEYGQKGEASHCAVAHRAVAHRAAAPTGLVDQTVPRNATTLADEQRRARARVKAREMARAMGGASSGSDLDGGGALRQESLFVRGGADGSGGNFWANGDVRRLDGVASTGGLALSSDIDDRDLPPVLQELRRLERRARKLSWTEPRLFVQQALLACDYEDDYEYEGEFSHYFPTYRAMSNAQLRGYFAWRTRVRRGVVEKTSLSFAFVYLYELINGIGSSSPEEGFRKLAAFCEAYRRLDGRIGRYARIWLDDYVVYHGLDRELLGSGSGSEGGPGAAHGVAYGEPKAGTACGDGRTESKEGKADARASAWRELAYDEALLKLARQEGEEGASGDGAKAETPPTPLSDAELAAVLSALASPRLDRSRFCRERPDDVAFVAARTWRALSAYYRKNRKSTLFQHLFGVRARFSYAMFRSAVFWESAPHPDAEYQVSGLCRYICRGGMWQCEQYYRAGERSSELGRMLRAVDWRMRERAGYPHKLREPRVPKYLLGIIDKQIDALEAARAAEAAAEAEREARRVSIDFSKLADIRQAAAATREALLVDEEREGGIDPSPTSISADAGGGSAFASEEAGGTTGRARGGEGADVRGGQASDGILAASESLQSGRASDFGDARGAEGADLSATPAADAAPTDAAISVAGAASAASASSPADGPFSADELAYLACLLEGASDAERAAVLARAGSTDELMADALNEKLYDALGDIAVEDSGDGPQIIEDYVEDVKGYAGL